MPSFLRPIILGEQPENKVQNTKDPAVENTPPTTDSKIMKMIKTITTTKKNGRRGKRQKKC